MTKAERGSPADKALKPDTQVTTGGRQPFAHHGYINPPVYHAEDYLVKLFGLGASWGGYESLAIPCDVAATRTATRWAPGGPAIRFHIGLEDPGDLIADLERGFAALAATR